MIRGTDFDACISKGNPFNTWSCSWREANLDMLKAGHNFLRPLLLVMGTQNEFLAIHVVMHKGCNFTGERKMKPSSPSCAALVCEVTGGKKGTVVHALRLLTTVQGSGIAEIAPKVYPLSDVIKVAHQVQQCTGDSWEKRQPLFALLCCSCMRGRGHEIGILPCSFSYCPIRSQLGSEIKGVRWRTTAPRITRSEFHTASSLVST